MMHARTVLIVAAALLAGCGERDAPPAAVARAGDGKTVSGFNIDTDTFKANIEVPGLTFGGEDMEIDGMKLYPGSRVRGVRVNASDKGGAKNGTVTMDFTSPGTPSAVAAHIAAEASKAGFAVTGISPAGFGGSKRDGDADKNFTVALAGDAATTTGTMSLTGSKAKSGW